MRTHLFAVLVACSLWLSQGLPLSAQTNNLPKGVLKGTDGKYHPAPGYQWLTQNVKDLRVLWKPGLRHPTVPNVISGTTEGRWNPAPGYTWLNNNPNDLRVVPAKPSTSFSPAPPTTSFYPPLAKPDKAGAVVKILGAAISHQIALENSKKDGLGAALITGTARLARDRLIEAALKDAFPQNSVIANAGIRRVVSLYLDKQLTFGNYAQHTMREEFIRALQRENTNLSNAAEVADFLYEVHVAYSRR